MTVKQFLRNYWLIDEEIKANIDARSVLNSMACKTTASSTGDVVGGSRDPHKAEDVSIKIIELERKINERIDELTGMKKRIYEMINALDNQAQRVVMIKRYLNHKQWQDIADEMRYDVSNIYIIHGKALKNLETFE